MPCPLARRCAMLIGTHADVKRNRRQVSEEEPWAETDPICSMYGIFTYIYPKNDPKYSRHGASGHMIIGLVYGKFYRKLPYFSGKAMVPGRSSYKPIQYGLVKVLQTFLFLLIDRLHRNIYRMISNNYEKYCFPF